MNCHKCKYNGKMSEACLSCVGDEKYCLGSPFRDHSICEDKLKAEEVEQCEDQAVFGLDDDKEDLLRRFFSDLFSLPPTQLLMLQAMVQHQTLTDFASNMEKLSRKCKQFTRFRAFQTRKALFDTLP